MPLLTAVYSSICSKYWTGNMMDRTHSSQSRRMSSAIDNHCGEQLSSSDFSGAIFIKENGVNDAAYPDSKAINVRNILVFKVSWGYAH